MQTIEDIRKPIANEWKTFEKLFETAFQSEDFLLNSALTYVYQNKGKQLRPILVLLAAKIIGEINENSHLSASSLEVLHTASLLHDDVVDCTNERRGKASVNAKFDNKTAVLVGDFLLTKSMDFMARTQDHDLVKCLVDLGKEVTRGELIQLQNAHKMTDENVYYSIIRRKTALLFASCTQAGAISVGADDKARETLRLFGENLGICFQIKDDIFDYTPQAHIGKPVLNDIREGKFTLPIIHALEQAPENEQERIIELSKNSDEIAKNSDYLLQFVAQHGGIDYAQQKMEEFKQKSLDCLAIFEDSDTKRALCNLLDFVLVRKN